MRLRDADDLPAALTTAELAELTGLSADVWGDVARGHAVSSIDIEPIRVGRALRWPTAPVLRALGLVSPEAGEQPVQQPLSVVPSESRSRGERAS